MILDGAPNTSGLSNVRPFLLDARSFSFPHTAQNVSFIHHASSSRSKHHDRQRSKLSSIMNFTSNEDDSNTMITIGLQNDEEILCSETILRKYSGYFAALLEGGRRFAESLSRCVELQHLEPESVKVVMSYLHNHEQGNSTNDQKFTNFVALQDALSEALDYLQIDGYTFQAI